jgi:uncharacterized protein (TIRG00374 family)
MTNDPAQSAREDDKFAEPFEEQKKGGWLMFLLRWTIAIVGIWWVLSQLTIRDRVFVLTTNEAGHQVVYDEALVEPFDPDTDDYAIVEDVESGETTRVPAEQLLHGPDQSDIEWSGQEVELAGMRLDASGERATTIYYFTPEFGDGYRVVEADVTTGLSYTPKPPRPLVKAGLGNMVKEAEPWLLVASIFVFPVTLLATGLRWWRLMKPLGINMSLGRAYVLNMVGLFYNSFMLGSTGGDFIKAFYAGRHAEAGRKAAAWMSVFVDRLAGLLVLVAMGGSAATIQYVLEDDKSGPVAVACLQVAWVSVAILLASGVGAFVLISAPARRVIRRGTGIGKLIDKAAPKTEEDVVVEEPTNLRDRLGVKAREGLDTLYDIADAYRNAPGRLVEGALLTVPVHAAVIFSAMLAGAALDLPIPWPYYFVCVPVIVLSASMPVSPQGAGVMEFFAVMLTRPQGATVAQGLALALCIRVVQILWNLTGGIFVLRGGYSEKPATSSSEPARASHGTLRSIPPGTAPAAAPPDAELQARH